MKKRGKDCSNKHGKIFAGSHLLISQCLLRLLETVSAQHYCKKEDGVKLQINDNTLSCKNIKNTLGLLLCNRIKMV